QFVGWKTSWLANVRCRLCALRAAPALEQRRAEKEAWYEASRIPSIDGRIRRRGRPSQPILRPDTFLTRTKSEPTGEPFESAASAGPRRDSGGLRGLGWDRNDRSRGPVGGVQQCDDSIARIEHGRPDAVSFVYRCGDNAAGSGRRSKGSTRLHVFKCAHAEGPGDTGAGRKQQGDAGLDSRR